MDRMAALKRILRAFPIFLSAVLLVASASARPLDAVEADRVRISAHLERVERELRTADVSRLTPDQLAERKRNIDRLHAYRLRGEFPHNTRHPGERVPYFIDDDGRACAVGALIIESGHADLARRISQGENNARLLDMKTPGIPEWVEQSGLTAAECARIQPSYCDDSLCEAGESPVCGASGTSYSCQRVLDECSNDTFAYDGECVDGGPPDGGPVVVPVENSDDEDSGDGGCTLAGPSDRRASIAWLVLALAGMAVRRSISRRRR